MRQLLLQARNVVPSHHQARLQADHRLLRPHRQKQEHQHQQLQLFPVPQVVFFQTTNFKKWIRLKNAGFHPTLPSSYSECVADPGIPSTSFVINPLPIFFHFHPNSRLRNSWRQTMVFRSSTIRGALALRLKWTTTWENIISPNRQASHLGIFLLWFKFESHL